MTLHRVTWAHPRGEVQEVLCDRHAVKVMDALTTLGIGCGGAFHRGSGACQRCIGEEAGREPREFLIFRVSE